MVNTKRNFEVFLAEDFIGSTTQHIPNKFHQQICQYGCYSKRFRKLVKSHWIKLEKMKREIIPKC